MADEASSSHCSGILEWEGEVGRMKPESGDRLRLHFRKTFAGRLEYDTLVIPIFPEEKIGVFL
jgi:hypothetical protein